MDWIIDTDMGLDDQISLLYLAEISKQEGSSVNIKAVLTQGTGLAHAESAKANAVRLLRFAGISAEKLPPVGIGVQETLEGFHQYPPAWRYQEDNLRGAILPTYSADVESQNNTSSALLEKILSNSSQKVSILEIGTHSTIAQVLSANPTLANKVDRIVSMIGAVDVPGNIHNTDNKVAEFNAWIDPVAAKTVFASGIPITMVSLDVTDKAPLTQDFVNKFRASTQGPVADLLVNWWEGVLRSPVGEYFHWDPLATVLAVDPDLITRQEDVKIAVNADLTPPGQPASVPFGSIEDFSLLNWQGNRRSSLESKFAGWTKRDETGNLVNVVFDANIPEFENSLISAFASNPPSSPSLRVAVFGDAGNSYTNGTNFYYSPGAYRRLDLGSTGPQQQAVAEMMRSWNPSDLIQLGDESYNVNSSTLLDYNIGQYYNDFIYPYAPPAYTQSGSIYTDAAQGGIPAMQGRKQWPYNLYNFPNGFPNPSDSSKPGGSADGVNHYFSVPGNHDLATIVGSYNDFSVNQVNFSKEYIGSPIGPDAYDYKNNINTTPAPPNNADFKGNIATKKVGSNQQLIDYHSYLGPGNPGNLKPGSLKIGKLDSDGYGIYYSVDLGDDGSGRPLLHVTMIDTVRLLTDAGYYDFNFQKKKGADPRYDVSKPITASQAQFQPSDLAPDAPSIGREMFLWAKADLEQSRASWNIVMGHHPAYHAGTTKSDDSDSYSSNAVVLDFLHGLRNSNDISLFQAYMNGHDHAYQRVQEMQASANGIGTGIPFFTIGNSGKALSPLNLSPYGSNVLEPINYSTFIGYDKKGKTLYNTDLNDASIEAPFLEPYQAAAPTSTGVSGFYSYSKSNYPDYDPSLSPIDLDKPVDPASQTITSPDGRRFDLKKPAYLTYLKSSQTDLSGLYGYGSGAAQVDAGDTYLMMHYQTAQPIDPAIALIGRSQAVSKFDPNTLFYRQWSPRTAMLEDLGLFSFDIDEDGSVTNVQLVQSGNGYFESDLAGSSYLTVDQDFEILGNNPVNPLGFNSSDPTRAKVRLSFSQGKLDKVSLINKGSDYQQLANAIRGSNVNGPTNEGLQNNSLLVGINIDLEAQYNLAATRPEGAEPYHDWYLITDTGLASAQTKTYGAFGAVDISLQARSQEARDILSKTPITTGYSGLGPQNKLLAPAQGGLRLIDALGTKVGEAKIINGQASVTLQALPAPGAVNLNFDGDALSSYQVNFRSIGNADQVHINLNYGSFSGQIQVQGQQLQLGSAQRLQVIRTDSGNGRVDLGLSQGSANLTLVQQAKGASQANLKAEQLFGNDPASNWLSSEGQAQGGGGSAQVGSGGWRPTAVLNGQELTLDSLELAANGVLARFAAGRPNDPSDDVMANFGLPSTGVAPAAGPAVLTVRRLSGMANGMALYPADPITGAVTDAIGASWLPGQDGYLPAALAAAQRQGLVLHHQDLPTFGQTKQFSSLPLNLSQNYGALLLVNDKDHDLMSSFAAANPNQTNQCLSLIAPGRGISFSFEDLRPGQSSDSDFNDLSFTLTAAQPIASI